MTLARALALLLLAAALIALGPSQLPLHGLWLLAAGALAIALARPPRTRAASALPLALYVLLFAALYAFAPVPRSARYGYIAIAAAAFAPALALWPLCTRRAARLALLGLVSLGTAAVGCVAAEQIVSRWEVAEPYGFLADEDSAAPEAFEPDDALTLRAAPGFRGRFRHPEYKHERFDINADGFRDDPWPSAPDPEEPRILLFGDSTIAGFGAELPEAIPALLQELLRAQSTPRVRVLNGGVPSWAARQHQIMLTRLGQRIAPDLVIAVFYDANDLEDGLNHFLSTREHGLHAQRLPSELSHPEGFEAPDLFANMASLRTPSLFTRTYWMRYSAFYRMVDFRVGALFSSFGWVPNVFVYNLPMLRGFAREPDAQIVDERQLALEALLGMAEACRKHGKAFAAARLPAKLQCEPDSFLEALREIGQDPAGFDRSGSGGWLMRELERRGVPSLDLLPLLEVGAGQRSPDYFREGHPNRAGNRKIAAEFARFLAERGLWPPRANR